MAPRSDRMDSRFTKPEETGYLADISQAPYGLPQRHDEPRHPDDGGMQLQRTGFAAYEDDGMMHYDNQPQGTTRRALQPRQSSDAFDHDSARVGQYEFSNGTACDQRGLPSRALLQRYTDDQYSRPLPSRDMTRYPLQPRGPTPAKAGNRASGTAISPFFNYATHALPPEATGIPPTRGSMMSGISNFHGAPNRIETSPDSRANRPFVVDSATQQSQPSPFMRPALPSRFQQYQYAPLSRSFDLPFRQSTAAPPTPRHRPAAAGRTSYQPATNRSAATGTSRNRITLPPSTARTHDYELTSVPGLRGSRNEGAYTQRGPGYADSRALLSAAGRRSVRR